MHAPLTARTLVPRLLLPALLLVGSAPAAQRPADEPLDAPTLERLVESLATTVEEHYVFEEVAREIGAALREGLWNGRYEVESLEELARRLTEDLRSVNDDRHLGVRPLPPRSDEGAQPSPEELARERQRRARERNFGFARVEVLEGNVGYLDLRGFSPAGVAGDTAVAAMGFLANVDALVIDLRQNGGGDPTMIQLLSSYFFAEPTHLNSFFWRGKEQIDQFWTLPHVPGKKLVDVPLFLLTSGYTFSAAEEFTYNLKHLGRATVVGATTGGGAHPGQTYPVEDLVTVFVPGGRAINPVTGTNWEGTGVVPHVPTQPEKALDEALRRAREAVAGS